MKRMKFALSFALLMLAAAVVTSAQGQVTAVRAGKIIGEAFPIGDRVDANIFDPSSNTVASATREGTLHIFHEDSPDKLSVVETVKTEFGAKTMGLDMKTHNLYLTTSDFGPAPAPTEKQPNPQPVATPGTFRLLIYGK